MGTIEPASVERRRLLALDAAFLLGIPDSPSLHAVTLTLPMFGMQESGAARGIFVDVIDLLARESGITIANIMATKIRAQVMISAGTADLLIGFDSAELLADARHVGQVACLEVGIIARAGIQLRSLADLRGMTVGQLRCASYVQAYTEDTTIVKQQINTMGQILQMLALGRIDAAIGGKDAMYYSMRREGISPQRFGPFFPLVQLQAWLHYSRKTYNDALARRLSQALTEMRKNGKISAIVRSYVEGNNER